MKHMLALTGLDRVSCHRAETKSTGGYSSRKACRRPHRWGRGSGMLRFTAVFRGRGRMDRGPERDVFSDRHGECVHQLGSAKERAWGHGWGEAGSRGVRSKEGCQLTHQRGLYCQHTSFVLSLGDYGLGTMCPSEKKFIILIQYIVFQV